MRNNTRIISISGNPASGKSTVVNRLIEKLKNNGFEDENIHIISAGSVFRDYYNKLKNLLKSIDNPKDLTESDFLQLDREMSKENISQIQKFINY